MSPTRVRMLEKAMFKKYEGLGQTKCDLHLLKIVTAINAKGRTLKSNINKENILKSLTPINRFANL